MKLKSDFDLIVVDGQGIAHPRRFGIACHLGVFLNKPTIGCAKKRLVGTYEMPENIFGAYSYLFDRDQKIGVVLRTKINVKPIFISPGHLVDIESAVRIIISLTGNYRLPSPVREADIYARSLKKGSEL